MGYKEILDEYLANIEKLDEIENLAADTSNKEVWTTNMAKRSNALTQLFVANNQLIGEGRKLNEKPISSAEEADELFECAFDYYLKFYDTQILAPMFLKLINYYESIENPDIDRKLAAYYIYSACINEIDVRNTRGKLFVDYYKKIVQNKDKFLTVKRLGKNVIICAYHSLICASLDSKAISYHEVVMYLKEFMEFVQKEEIKQSIIEAELYEKVLIYLEKCLGIFSIVYDLDLDDVLVLKEFLSVMEKIDGISPQVIYEANLYLDTYDGNITYLHAAQKILESFVHTVKEYDKYKSKYQEKKVLKDKENAIWLEFMNTPFVFENFVSRIEDRMDAQVVFTQMDALVNRLWTDIKTTDFINVYPQLIGMWVRCKIKYIDDKASLKKTILNGILKKQVPTYIHSVMVKNIALTIYNENKDYFKDIPVDNVEEYIHDAALFHDIGKISIATIINTQDRELSKVEFDGIERHPQLGLKIIKHTDILDSFKDVILYHHKYYDGSKGYPEGNDNLKSPYKKVIDLVTIADCIDAGTDYFGRNYKKAKSVYEVIEELNNEKGVRYNPDIVDCLMNSDALKKSIIKITQDERKDLMYQALKEGLEGM